MKPNVPAIGIDLGTTFSVVARLDDTGRPTTVSNREGDLTTPSVVLFDGSDLVVGREAAKALSSEPDRVADCPKRQLGSRHYPRTLAGQQMAPEVLEAIVLRKLVNDARRQAGDFDRAVITVPAYFDDVRRKATQDAGYMAGLEVLDIINEPTAAAVAFGYQQGFLSPRGQASAAQRILVYDLGGGTFDVTVMELDGQRFTTLATDGDACLGGCDWDERLVEYVAGQFAQRYGVDPRSDPAAAGRLNRDCEDAKRTLSARQKAVVHCDCQGHSLRLEITRDVLEELTRDLLERTRYTTLAALRAAGLDWGGIDRVLLVGGSTRMPMVVEMLGRLSGKQPDASVSADEAVAHGAALRAGVLLAEAAGRPPGLTIRNVNSHSLGVVGTDRLTGRKRNAVVIPRNTPLPVVARRVFRTQQDGQRTVLVQVIEGESLAPDGCTAIGQCVVRDLPADLPAGSAIDVRFGYAADGRLSVAVEVGQSRLRHEFQRGNGLSQSELDAWRRRLESPRAIS